MNRLIDVVTPPRLGRSFRWLLSSSWLTNLGDGLEVAAGPLLIASQTRDPRLVAAALVVQRLPVLLFGLYAGVLADRLDRRRLVIVVNVSRAVVLASLAVTIWAGLVNVVVVLATFFLLGLAETFADATTSTLLPMMVEKRDLGVANARLTAGHLTANHLVGPPIGAALFALGMSVPFVTQAVCVGLGAVLISRIVVPPVERAKGPSKVWAEVAEGFRWLWHHPAVRTLALTVFFFNLTFGAAWSVLVLLAIERLGMGEVGYGLLLTSMAIGGLVGTTAYGWLERHFSLADLMRGGLLIETSTHLILATTTTPSVAAAILFFFGIHEVVWGTTSGSIRQRLVPTIFQGRVGSVSMLAVFGGLVIGGALGGVIAGRWGVTGPFWYAFVGSAVILALIWRELAHIAHQDAAA
ncbi:MAG: MFS transporter [Actinobacteria bacterium]|nr:MFS transporter [Actinomycetota bacterium]